MTFNAMQHIFNVPGVSGVGMVSTSLLPEHLLLRALCKLPVIFDTSCVEWFDILPEAECEVVSEISGSHRKETASLTFSTAVYPDLKKDSAYVIRDNDKHIWILGHRERPYPTAKITQRFGSTKGDPKSYETVISLVSIMPLIKAV